jgi:hypothetical protein
MGQGPASAMWSERPGAAPRIRPSPLVHAQRPEGSPGQEPTPEAVIQRLYRLLEAQELRQAADEQIRREQYEQIERMREQHDAQFRRIAELESAVQRPGAESAHARDAVRRNQMGTAAPTRRWGGDEDGGEAGGLSDHGAPDDDDGDDARSEASVATSASTVASSFKLNAAFYTSAEMESLKCNMTRSEIVDRLPELRDSLEQRHCLIEELLGMGASEWREAVDERPDLREADLRSACLQSCDWCGH